MWEAIELEWGSAPARELAGQYWLGSILVGFVLVFIFLFCLSKYFLSHPMGSVLLPVLSLIPLGGMSK